MRIRRPAKGLRFWAVMRSGLWHRGQSVRPIHTVKTRMLPKNPAIPISSRKLPIGAVKPISIAGNATTIVTQIPLVYRRSMYSRSVTVYAPG